MNKDKDSKLSETLTQMPIRSLQKNNHSHKSLYKDNSSS
jgi:hypothetical protein